MTVAEKGHRPAGRAMDGGILPGRPPREELRRTTVVIPALNVAATIGVQLAALARQEFDGEWEVLVCDNGSTDATREIVAGFASRVPGLRVVDASDARGAAHARNVGAAAGGDLIAYCDADDEVEPGWLAALVRTAADADVVGGSLEHQALNDPDIAALRGGAETALPRAFGFLPYAISANVAVRRTAWEAIGGWDEECLISEDVEFSWRAQLAGLELAFAPDAVARYRHRTSLRASARQVYGYADSSARIYRRYRGAGAQRRSLRRVASSWAFLATRLPFVVLSRRRRGSWLIAAAENAGRIRGSIRYRVFCP